MHDLWQRWDVPSDKSQKATLQGGESLDTNNYFHSVDTERRTSDQLNRDQNLDLKGVSIMQEPSLCWHASS